MLDRILSELKLLIPSSFSILDFIQIVIIYIVLYYCIKTVKGTRAWMLAKGIGILGLAYLVFYATGMTVLQYILQALFNVFMIAIVIMIQPELQRFVEKIGTNNIGKLLGQFKKKKEEDRFYSIKTIDEVVQACENMSEVKTGALIVFERETPLSEYIQSGISIKAKVSNQLLINTFEKNTPLHDGAVIIRDDKLEAATCYLPLTSSKTVKKSLGTRHRAGIGVSELTDCIVVIVSEETGAISVCKNGQIKHDLTRNELYNELTESSLKSKQLQIHKKHHHSMSIWWKILTLICSIILWGIIIGINDPVVTKTFRNIPINIVNENVLEDADKTYHITNGTNANIEVTAKRSIIDNISNDDIEATADISEMSIVNAVPVKATLKGNNISGVKLEIVSDKILKLELEEIIQGEIGVSVQTIGKVADGYYLYQTKPITESIIVTGPKSIVNTIGKAEATVDVNGMTDTYICNSKIIVYDKNGAVIDGNNVTFNIDATRVNVVVYQTKEISVISELLDNINFELKKFSAPNILVAARSDILSNIRNITVILDPTKIDINTNKMLVDINLYLSEDVYLPNGQPNSIEVEFNIVEKEKPPIELSGTKIDEQEIPENEQN